MPRLIPILIFVLNCPVYTVSAAEQVIADAVYTGARVYTAKPDSPWAQALAVRDGRLVYVGDNDGAGRFVGEGTVRHDLQDRLVLPGLIDGHVHPGFIAMFNGLLSLPEAANREAQMADIAALLKSHDDKPVIHAIGWDNRWFGTDGPHRRDLDRMESDRPVMIHDITMHSVWVNSRALELSGIGADPQDPLPGVAYYKRDEKGELTGYITEAAALDFVNRFARIGPQEEKVLLDFLRYLRRVGVTTVFDAGNFGMDEEVYRAAQRLDLAGELPQRYHGAYTLFLRAQLRSAVSELKRLASAYNTERVRIDTLKVFFDGVVETRTGHMLEDYDDTPGNRGGSLLSREEMHGLILQLDRDGLHLHVHTIGDQAVRTLLDAVEDARRSLERPPRSRITLTHLQVVAEADLRRFDELDVIAQFTPAWHGFDLPFYESALGSRARHPYPVRPLLDRGAVVSFSSDVYFPSEWRDGSASPFTGIQVGHTRQFREDAPDGPRSGPASERLELDAMLHGYTRNAAWQLGQENSIGSLETGKRADFIVLEKDLFQLDPAAIHQLRPAAVLIGGQLVDGRLKTD